MDCHTAPASILPFIPVREVNDNDEWAHQFSTYPIKGFSDIVNGCIDHFMNLSENLLKGLFYDSMQHIFKI